MTDLQRLIEVLKSFGLKESPKEDTRQGDYYLTDSVRTYNFNGGVSVDTEHTQLVMNIGNGHGGSTIFKFDLSGKFVDHGGCED